MLNYKYDGPVLNTPYTGVINNRWVASTCAISEEKAKSNLAYQYKKKYGLVANTKIYLPNSLMEVQYE
jgi:hypothetical protein